MSSAATNISAILLLTVISLAQGVNNKCSNYINRSVCSKSNLPLPDSDCTAQYEGIFEIQPKIRQYINNHIINSYQYILMSTNFGNHKINRPGFEALYRKLSDDTWEDAIELIKYNAKRGGKIEKLDDFRDAGLVTMLHAQKTGLHEYNSLAKALDIQKELATGAHDIHKDAIRQGNLYHDPEISSFIEKEFVHKHAATIRTLAGHLNDLNVIMGDYQQQGGPSLSLYLFDEYLQKSLGVESAAV